MRVQVVGHIDEDTGLVLVQDSVGNEYEVDASVRPKGTGLPLPGEKWTIERLGSQWTFDLQVGVPPTLAIGGSRAGMHPIEIQILETLTSLGLALDGTDGRLVIDDPILVHIPTASVEPPDNPTPDDPAPVEDPTDPDYPFPGEDIQDPEDAPNADPDGAGPDQEDGPALDLNDKGTWRDQKWVPLYVGTYNIAFSMGNAGAWAGLNRFASTRVQVFGVQEFWSRDRQVLCDRLAAKGWKYHRPTSPHGAAETIFWLDSDFELLNSGDFFLTGEAGKFAPTRHVAWVKLRHKDSNRPFFFHNTHWDTYGNTHDWGRIYEQISKTAAFAASHGETSWVFTVGDTNRNYKQDLREKHPQWPFVQFKSTNTQATWSLLDKGFNYGTRGGSLIDTIWLTRGGDYNVKADDHWILRGYPSDHRPVLAKFMVKNSRKLKKDA